MARNGSGTYSLYTPGNPVVTGTTITSTAFNNTMNDIATALTQSIAADGQTPITANIPMNSKKLTGLAAGTTSGDALSYGQSGASLTTLSVSGALSGSTQTMSAQPSFNAQRTSTNQTLSAPAVTDLIFNTANSNVSSSYATGTGIFTAPTTGVYLFAAGVFLKNSGLSSATLNDLYFSKNNNTSGTTGLYFALNMTIAQQSSLGPAGNAFMTSGSVVVAMTAGDTMRVKCDMGGSNAIIMAMTSYFSGCQLC